MTAVAALALILLAWALLLGLGAAMSFSWGLRGPTALAAALPFSCGGIAAMSAASLLIPIPFRPSTVLFAMGLVALLGLVIRAGAQRTLLGRWWERTRVAPSPANGWLFLGVLVAALLLTAVPLVLAAGGDLNLSSQTWDAMYHANAVRFLADTANASPRSTHYPPELSPLVFVYPSGFHAISALITQAFGINSVAACNVAAAILGGGLWPSGMVLLSQRVFGACAGAAGTTAILSTCLWGLPWAPMGYGVLWPTLAASAWSPVIVTGFLACGVNILGRVKRVPQALVALCLGVASLGVGLNFHPRSLLLLLPVLVLAAASLLASFIADALKRRSAIRSTLGASMLGALVIGSLLGLDRLVSAHFSGHQAGWPVTETPRRALFEYLVAGPHNTGANYLVAGLLFIGAIACATRLRTLWIPVAYLMLVIADVLTGTTRIEGFMKLSRYWYNDQYRVAAVVPIVGVLLGVAGIRVLARLVARVPRRANLATASSASAIVLLALSMAAVLTTLPSHTAWLARSYKDAANLPVGNLVSPREMTFFDAVSTLVPPGARVLNNPTDGSALLYAYAGIEPLFFSARKDLGTEDARQLRYSFGTSKDLGTTCQRVKSTGASWVISLGPTLSEGPDGLAPGLSIPSDVPLARLAAQDGELRLWRITGC